MSSEEGLNDLFITSQNTVHSYDISFNVFNTNDRVIPTEIHDSAEDHDHDETHNPEDHEESINLDENDSLGPSGRNDHRYVQEASCVSKGLNEFFGAPNPKKVQRNYPSLEKQFQLDVDTICSRDDNTVCSNDDDNGTTCSNDGDSFMGFDQDKNSDSDSDDNIPPSPGYSCNEKFLVALFNTDYIPKMDKWSRVLFPLAFVVFNVFYWAYHIN